MIVGIICRSGKIRFVGRLDFKQLLPLVAVGTTMVKVISTR